MKAEVYWIEALAPGRLGVMPRPRGNDWLEDEVSSLVSEGVQFVVSLLTKDEVSELGLEREGALCRV